MNPGDSIQQAIYGAAVGDTILVSSGVYKERFMLNKTVHLVGEGMKTTIVDGEGQGSVAHITANGASISGFTLMNSGPIFRAVGVFIADYVNVTGNTLSSDLSSGLNGAGVDISLSNHTMVDNNIFVNNERAINISRSDHNMISNNRAIGSDDLGVTITDSSNNTIFQNVFVGGKEGLSIVGSLGRQNNVTRNLIRSMNITGIFLLDLSSKNILSENTFELNHFAVDLQNSVGNVFFHNSFLRSDLGRHVVHVFSSDVPLNTWDNHILGPPYPGGNYWDDYNGTDTSVPSDGIGDTNLPADGLDHYPLMVPFVPVPILALSVSPDTSSGVVPFKVSFTVDVLGTLKPFSYSWNFGDNTLLSNEASPSHTYESVGSHNVSVVVKDTSGDFSVGTARVEVTNPPGQGLNTWSAAGLVLAVGLGIVGVLFYRRRRGKSRNGSGSSLKSMKRDR